MRRWLAAAGLNVVLGCERLLGEPASWRSDLFAVGVIAYEMLIGDLPFGRGTLTDVVRTYDMLGHASARRSSARLKRKRFSPSLFVVHFSTEGAWPHVPHHSILFGPRYKGLLDDIYVHGVLPADFSIYLHHPTVTDPSMAPPGKSTFYALVPVALIAEVFSSWSVWRNSSAPST